jgi:hypothetical protein
MVAGPRNHFVIHNAGILDSGLLLATDDGLFIGSHTVPRKPIESWRDGGSYVIDFTAGQSFGE